MALTEPQKDMIRLMQHVEHHVPETIKAFGQMNDEDAIAALELWKQQKREASATQQGLLWHIAEIEALEV